MSQEQPRRTEQEAITYGEVFEVSGELASKPITPRDAATVQSVESQILGETRKGGPAAVMESAAARNERASVVSHDQVTDLARNQGVTISEDTNEGGNRVITETLAGQVVGQSVEDDVAKANKGAMVGDEVGPTVDEGAPASSVQAPQVRATEEEHDFISNQGVAAATDAATLNPRLSANQDEEITQSNVSTDNQVTRENPNYVISSVPGGMGASMATADQRLTRNKMNEFIPKF